MNTAISRIVQRFSGRHHAKHATAPPVVPRARLWRRGVSTAALAALSATALVAQGSVLTDATWNDSEWVNSATVGTLNCADPNIKLYTRGEGRLLSGSLLGINLDTLAEASGVEVTNNSERSNEARNVATALGNDAYANPLNVTALSAVDVNLGNGLLQLPMNNNTGVIGQYGQAESDGHAVGASGLITNSGGIATTPGNTYPELANLNLKNLLNSSGISLGDLVSNVSDLDLSVGAVAGRAALDGCEAAWSRELANPEVTAGTAADIVDGLRREYLVASAELTVASPAVSALAQAVGGNLHETCQTTARSILKNIECTVNGLVSDTGVINAIKSGVIGVLGTLTDGLGLGNIDVTLTATAKLDRLRTFLSLPARDDGGVVSIDLQAGTVTIDTAALLQSAYPGNYSNGLNGLPPNTSPLNDPKVLNTLTQKITAVLDAWVAQLSSVVVETLRDTEATARVIVHLELTVGLAKVSIGHIEARVGCGENQVQGCTLRTLLDPDKSKTTTTAKLELLPGLASIPIIGSIVNSLLNGVVGALIAALIVNLTAGLGGLIGSVLDGALDTVKVVPQTVNALTEPIVQLVTALYRSLFLDGVLSLTINAQNAPGNGSFPPVDWLSGQPSAPPEGRYEVAAIRIGVLDALESDGVRLYLGRASVGAVCTPLQASQPGSPCADY